MPVAQGVASWTEASEAAFLTAGLRLASQCVVYVCTCAASGGPCRKKMRYRPETGEGGHTDGTSPGVLAPSSPAASTVAALESVKLSQGIFVAASWSACWLVDLCHVGQLTVSQRRGRGGGTRFPERARRINASALSSLFPACPSRGHRSCKERAMRVL